jgi:superfamily II DNA or RNA helicase
VSNGYKGTVEAVTGFGKSFIAILTIQRMNKVKPHQTALIIVPTLYLQEQWMQHIKEHQLTNTQVLVINTAVRVHRTCDLLILDEIHRYAADVFGQVFGKIEHKAILGLTATIKRADKRHPMLLQHAPIVCTVSVQEALAEGYISPFLVYNLGLKLTSKEKVEYDAILKNYNYNFSFFDHSFVLVQQCLNDEFSRVQIARKYNKDADFIHRRAIHYMRSMGERRRFLYNTQMKIDMAAEIIKSFPVRTICFAETTEFADTLTEQLNQEDTVAVSYHSGMGVRKRRKAMEDFKDSSNSVRVISTARALDEGFDIEGIEMALITSGTSTERQFTQRMGRSIRFVPNKIALVINLYIKDTQDERWAKQRQSATPNVYWIDSLEEISYEEPEGKSSFEALKVPRFSLTGSSERGMVQ